MNSESPRPDQQTAGQSASVLQLGKQLLQDIGSMLGDRFELLAVEIDLAVAALLRSLLLLVALAVVALTAWLLFWSLLMAGLIALEFSWVGAVGLAFVVQLGLIVWIALSLRRLSTLMKFSGSRRHWRFPLTGLKGTRSAPAGDENAPPLTGGPEHDSLKKP